MVTIVCMQPEDKVNNFVFTLFKQIKSCKRLTEDVYS